MGEPAYPLDFLESDGQSWPVQGTWTYEDYLRLPDDGRRYEVLRGVLYVTPSPIYDHQFAVIRLGYYLTDFILKNDLGVLLPAPFDVRLPRKLADPVEPDLLWVRKGNEPKAGDKDFSGVPDLVVEVLSPGTRGRDQGIKVSIYQEAGIPEYWLVDPKARTVVIYGQSEDGRRYVEWARGGVEDVVGSTVLAGLRLAVDKIFPC